MNKEELIKLRNELTEQRDSNKKYVIGNIAEFAYEKKHQAENEDVYVTSYSNKELYNKVFTKKEIKEMETTEEAIKYLESSIEEYLKELINKGYDVNIFSCSILPTCILSEDYRNEIYTTFDNNDINTITPPIGNDILDDDIVINISDFSAEIGKNSNTFKKIGSIPQNMKNEFYNTDAPIYTTDIKEEYEQAKKYNKYFIVKCSKFFEALRNLNYEIKAFDEYSKLSNSEFFEKIVDLSLHDVAELFTIEIEIDLIPNKKKSH